MNHRWILGAIATTVLALPLAAQSSGPATATLAPGKYTIQAHDSTKPFAAPLPFELKANGSFVISTNDGTFSGKMKVKDGTLTYSDQGCVDDKDSHQREGTYTVRSERGGFWLEVQSDPCEGRGKSLADWLFVPAKK